MLAGSKIERYAQRLSRGVCMGDGGSRSPVTLYFSVKAGKSIYELKIKEVNKRDLKFQNLAKSVRNYL